MNEEVRTDLAGFAASLVLGAAIWLASPVLTGPEEAFDAFGYYLLSLLVSGLLLGLAGRRAPGALYAGLVLGQGLYILYRAISRPAGPLWLVGLMSIVFLSPVALPGVLLGKKPGGALRRAKDTP